jgi:hypothetical protein
MVLTSATNGSATTPVLASARAHGAIRHAPIVPQPR